MGIFTDVERIERLDNELRREVRKRFWGTAKDYAEEIAEYLIEEKGLDDVCRDIDEAISEAEDYIHEDADTAVTYTYDNWLLALYAPVEIEEQIDEDLVKYSVCEEKPEYFMDRTITLYAYEIWREGIRMKLKEILKDRCAKVGLLGRVRTVVKG